MWKFGVCMSPAPTLCLSLWCCLLLGCCLFLLLPALGLLLGCCLLLGRLLQGLTQLVAGLHLWGAQQATCTFEGTLLSPCASASLLSHLDNQWLSKLMQLSRSNQDCFQERSNMPSHLDQCALLSHAPALHAAHLLPVCGQFARVLVANVLFDGSQAGARALQACRGGQQQGTGQHAMMGRCGCQAG